MGYPLIVSRKNDCVRSPAVIPVAFGQIEQWTKFKWQPFVYNANWSDVGGGARTGGYCQDPMGFVHLRGFLMFTGTINNNTTSTITTLPAAYSPQAQETFNDSGQMAFVDVLANGTVRINNLTGGNMINPQFWLSGMNYTVF